MEEAGAIIAFSLDLGKCTGCEACRLACTIENDLEWGTSWRQVVTFNPHHHPDASRFHLSLACNHCTEAPCMEGCPALAYSRDETSGAVLLHEDLCIGCRYCSWVCPFDAPRYRPAQGVMSKCTFCSHRLAIVVDPACVASCPTGALGSGNLEEMSGVETVPGFPPTDVGPSIRFASVESGRSPGTPPLPRGAVTTSMAVLGNDRDTPSSIRPRTEWSLLAFTLLTALLVGVFSAGLAGVFPIDPVVFTTAVGGGAAVSLLHLGRKRRAWRAVLNLRKSWLSREVATYSVFGVLATASLLAPSTPFLGGTAGLAGFATLFCMDRVYPVALRASNRSVHSADVLLTGSFLTAIFLGKAPLFLALGLLKMLLYLRRRHPLANEGLGGHVQAQARVLVGLLLPAILWFQDSEGLVTTAFAAIALGELIDRWEFYDELEVSSPRRQVDHDLRRILALEGGPRGPEGRS